MTVYADVLFLVNFSMDLLTLVLASRITHKKVSRVRLLVSSAFGGISGTILSLWDIGGLTGAVLNLLIMTAMTILAFGIKGNPIRNSLIVCGSGTLLGGIMTVLLSAGEPVILDYGGAYPTVFLLCAAAAGVFGRMISAACVRKNAEVAFSADGIRKCFTALCDSGCFLTEPISGLPVITVSDSVLGELNDRLRRQDVSLKLRIIPVKTVTGEGILYGFVPDEVSVDGCRVRAVIAAGRDSYGGFDGIVPAALTGRTLKSKQESEDKL